MQVYLVGGAVRDKLLQRPIKDKDFVVVGATPEQMLDAGFVQVGADFPVFLHPKTKHEYALARTERKSGKGYKGFEVYAAPDITIEQDLLRRDLTINAMAIEVSDLFDDTPLTGDIVDPYNGQQDIENKILRHVSDAFREDPLRVLRIARFYGRFYNEDSNSNDSKNFTIADETLTLIRHIIDTNELSHLTAERVWTETSRAMMQASPQAYFDCLQQIGALTPLMPKLATVWQNARVHRIIATALQLAGQFNLPLHNRWALLMLSLAPHTIETFLEEPSAISNAKIHTDTSVSSVIPTWTDDIQSIGNNLKVPKAYTQFALLYANNFCHLNNIEILTAKQLVKLIQHTKAQKDTSDLHDLLTVHSLMRNVKHRLTLNEHIATFNSISIKDIDPNLTGSAIGDALNDARIGAITKKIQ